MVERQHSIRFLVREALLRALNPVRRVRRLPLDKNVASYSVKQGEFIYQPYIRESFLAGPNGRFPICGIGGPAFIKPFSFVGGCCAKTAGKRERTPGRPVISRPFWGGCSVGTQAGNGVSPIVWPPYLNILTI